MQEHAVKVDQLREQYDLAQQKVESCKVSLPVKNDGWFITVSDAHYMPQKNILYLLLVDVGRSILFPHFIIWGTQVLLT